MWMKEYQQEESNGYVIIVGNKIDERDRIEVTKEEGENFAKEKGFQHMLCSAKTGEGVSEIFRMMIEGIYHDEKIMSHLPHESNIKLIQPNKRNGGCCGD